MLHRNYNSGDILINYLELCKVSFDFKLQDKTFTDDSAGNCLTSSDTTALWFYNHNNELCGYDGIIYVSSKTRRFTTSWKPPVDG